MMDWIYTAISWILLRWHDLWDLLLPGGATFLGTNWDWILAIIFLVITIRIILFPIFVKQIRSQRAMQALQPKLKELQAKHKGDQETLRQEMMKLYQTEKVNPLMGCLPMFLQIPVFLGLFHVLQRLDPAQTANTTLYGWTQQEWDSAAVARLFTAPIAARFADGSTQLGVLGAHGVTVKVVAGVLVLIMMSTTFLTSRQMILKTGWSADPQQRMIQKLMLYGIPFSLLLSGWYFPIGVIIYWVTQNLFSLGQQYWVLHKYPPPVMEGAVPMGAKRTAEPERKNALQRFLSPSPKTAGPVARTGFVNPVATSQRGGLFRRKAAEPTTPAPTLDTRALAPKPGAKPMRVKPTVIETAEAPAKAPAPAGTEREAEPKGGANGAAARSGGEPATGAKAGAGASASGKANGQKPAGQRKPATSTRKKPTHKKGGPRR
ncbi:MAG TPA: membrane protein insertase YidC [Micromonosporaceae bacterium]